MLKALTRKRKLNPFCSTPILHLHSFKNESLCCNVTITIEPLCNTKIQLLAYYCTYFTYRKKCS